jgi:hypothetical protein
MHGGVMPLELFTVAAWEKERQFHEYDTAWYGRKDSYSVTLMYSLFNRYCGNENARGTYPNLSQEERETLIPVLEAWERAIDNWDIEGL